jgi:hypothetical protein
MSCPQPTREPTAATEPDRRPGWPEILVGLAVFAVVGYGIPVLMKRLGARPRSPGVLVHVVNNLLAQALALLAAGAFG